MKQCYESPLGRMWMRSDGEALTGLWFEGQTYAPPLDGEATGQCAVFVQTVRWLDAYFGGAPLPELPPLRPEGTDFRQAVWRRLRDIPYGQTTTYGALAQQVAAELGRAHLSAQAVGGAVGHNPIAILVPCHRVIGADGSLTGYAGGLSRKRALLEREKT